MLLSRLHQQGKQVTNIAQETANGFGISATGNRVWFFWHLVNQSSSFEGGNVLVMKVIFIQLAHLGDDFVLMDDIARPHRARIIEKALRNKSNKIMNWPARSPNMTDWSVWAWYQQSERVEKSY